MTPVLLDSVHSDSSLSDLNERANRISINNIIENTPNEIPFGKYIFRRLQSCGIKSIFGVPGDYNLNLLEQMYSDESSKFPSEINWVGCCNELNAAYAADGYSRYTNKIGCLVTTYGVGELSAINGIAGAFAEDVKLLHIVGVVSQAKMRSGKNFHHLVPDGTNQNLNTPNYKIGKDMIDAKISCSSKFIDDISTACDDFDDLLEDIFRYSKPGFLFLPEEFANLMVTDENLMLNPSIKLEDCIVPSTISFDSIDRLTEIIKDLIYQSKTPGIIADVLVDRYGGNKALNELVNKTEIWNFSTILGKSIIDEGNDNYMGVFNGDDGREKVNEKIKECDLILHFGIYSNETNNGNYTQHNYYAKKCKIIEFHSTYIRIIDRINGRDDLFKNLNFIHVLKKLVKIINSSKLIFDYPTFISENGVTKKNSSKDEMITQDKLTNTVINHLNPGDVLLCDTGSFQFSIRDEKLPSKVKYISQSFYLSIGMALPAALGVGVGMQDYPRLHLTSETDQAIKPRLILCEGDGAAQMTIQELSTMIRYKIPMDIFLWNNNGYTIERVIKGPTRNYNDIQPWNWTFLMKAFGDANEEFAKNYKVNKQKEFENLLQTIKKTSETKQLINFVEVELVELDVPNVLQNFMDRMKANAQRAQSH